ncbi:MAG: hypothetical protein B6U78_00885 [Candidatus Aenigmarchaeota archaeon ex4484_224]|nr:MAG: hypothetical protein B6U78_00885 [Candidatus Aenigmarchaeota archaeon ex4484_224]
MEKQKILTFFKFYSIFLLFPLIINLPLEILHSFSADIFGIIIFFIIFNSFGCFLFFFKNLDYKQMGILSLIFGMFLEFTLMKPEWVIQFYNLIILPENITALIVSSIYWFLPWSLPTLTIQKFLKK